MTYEVQWENGVFQSNPIPAATITEAFGEIARILRRAHFPGSIAAIITRNGQVIWHQHAEHNTNVCVPMEMVPPKYAPMNRIGRYTLRESNLGEYVELPKGTIVLKSDCDKREWRTNPQGTLVTLWSYDEIKAAMQTGQSND